MKPIVKKFFSVLTAGVMLCTSQIVTAYDAGAPEAESVLKAAAQADSGDVQQIALNTEVTDALTSSSDVNWYQFTVTDYGYVSIDFSHAYINSGNRYWQMTVYDTTSDTNQIYTDYFCGNDRNADPVLIRSFSLGLEKGTYKIKICDNYYSGNDYTLKVNFTKDANWERELNDSKKSADPIALNSSISGSLRSSSDVDWYTFEVDEYGYTSIDFSHAYINSSNSYWILTVYDTTPAANEICSYYYCGNDRNADPVKVRSVNLGLEKGTYAIKVTDNYYSGNDYTLTVNFTKDANWETEFNDTKSAADPIALNSSISGSLRSSSDVDWYTFEVDEYGYTSIDFSHAYINSSNSYWILTVYDTTPAANEICSYYYKGNDRNADPVLVRSVNLGLEKGTYAIKVTDNYYSGNDYTLTVNFTKDANWETEFNDSASSADPLPLNSHISGSMRSSSDADYYTFTLDEEENVYVDFSHAYINSSNSYWIITVYDTTPAGNQICTYSYKGTYQNTLRTIK